MMDGMKYGLTLSGPFSASISVTRSRFSSPPSPTPMKHPVRSRSSSESSRPASSMAIFVAAMENCVKRHISLILRRAMNSAGSKFFTSAAIRQL
jgi:hypothetical protein